MKREYKIDPAHSSAQFSVRHMMITNVRGGFSGVEGAVVYDQEDPAGSSVNVTIDVSTINSMDAQRDAHLKSADFLDSANYPQMVFKSSQVTAEGDGKLRVSGQLTIHGVTRPVILDVEGPTEEGKDPWGNLRIGATGVTKIKRSDFDLKWNQALETGGVLVGDTITIALDVSLIRT